MLHSKVKPMAPVTAIVSINNNNNNNHNKKMNINDIQALFLIYSIPIFTLHIKEYSSIAMNYNCFRTYANTCHQKLTLSSK